MPKIVILPLSLLIDYDQLKSINAFSKEFGISKWSIYRQWGKLNHLFSQYRTDQLSTEQLRREIAKLFPKVHFSRSHFETAWNRMIDVTERTRAWAKEIEALEKQGVTVYLYSSTNRLHYEHIRQQLGGKIPGQHFLSFDQGKLGIDLFRALIAQIKLENPGITQSDIVMGYQAPVPSYPWWLGPLAWVYSPFAKMQYNGACALVQNLLRECRISKAFELLAWTLPQNMVDKVKQKGWVAADALSPSDREALLAKPRHSVRYALRERPAKTVNFNVGKQEVHQPKSKLH